MQDGNLAFSSAMSYTSRIVVGGVRRYFASWDVSRELSGYLPAQVSLISGLVQATGTIMWAPDRPVDDFPTTPMNASSGWMPRKGDPVQIYEGDGVNEWQVFDGVIDTSSGTVGDPGFQSKIIDYRDKLSKAFRHDPLLRTMPPLERAASAYRGVGLSYLYFVDAALRKAGFHATPPAESRQAVSVPAQSSMWPESGVMTAGTVGGVDGGPWASYWDSTDGVAISNVLSIYSPSRRLPYGDLMRVSLTVDPSSAGRSIITCRYDGNHRVQLSVSPGRMAHAVVDGTTVVSLALDDAVRVSMLIDGTTIALRTDTGGHIEGSHPVITSDVLQSVQCQADTDARVAGFHVCYPSASTRWAYTNFVPTARYRLASTYLVGIMDAGPALTEGTCYDILDEISQATLSAMWIDETGVFQWAPSNVLSSAAPVKSITTEDDILSMPWSDDLLSVRSEVTVTQRTPAVTSSRWDNVLWYQGRATSLESGQATEEFISPATDEDWVQPSPNYLVYGDPGTGAPGNRGWGSLTGAVLAADDSESNGANYLTSSLEKINGDTYKLTHSARNLPSGATLELRYESEAASIWPRWRGESFPFIRGFASVQWADTEIFATEAGPDWAPPLVHPTGPWLSRERQDDNIAASRLADYIQTQTSREWPSVGDMGVRPDPRLQLGDRITVRSDQYIGTIFSGVIVRLDRLRQHGESAMQISLRLTSMTTTYQTYEAWSNQHPGVLSYDQWSSLIDTQTYQQFKISED